MKTLHLSLIVLIAIIFLGFGLLPAHADNANSVSIQNIVVQPSTVKVGDMFTVTATLVNNSTIPIILDGGTCVPLVEHVPLFTIMLDNHTKIKSKNLNCAGVGLSQILNSSKDIIGTSPDSTFFYIATEPGTANVTVTFSYHMINQTDPMQPNIEHTISKSFLFNIQDNNTNAIPPSVNHSHPVTLGQSPLKQFKSGITATNVKCNSGLWLVTKTEDGSPACVRPDTAYILIHHGWAKEVSQTSLYTIPTISSAPCDEPYPQSNTGVAVLYMSPNSTGKICSTYHNPDSPTQPSISVFIAKDMQQQASEITTSAYPNIIPTGNSTIVYTIKTGSQAGFYGMSFFCDSIPFVVGYDNQSRIILDDFPWLYKNDICLSQTNVFQITGLSGIHVKYVTQVHRN